jgi:hypothetical protein
MIYSVLKRAPISMAPRVRSIEGCGWSSAPVVLGMGVIITLNGLGRGKRVWGSK